MRLRLAYAGAVLMAGYSSIPLAGQEQPAAGGPGVTIQIETASGMPTPAPSPPTSVQLVKRTFTAPPGFFASTGILGTESDGMGGLSQDVLRSSLRAKGLTFPPGAAAAYLPVTRKLVLVDTPEQIELMSKLIQQSGGGTNVSGVAISPSPPVAQGFALTQPSTTGTVPPPGSAFIQQQLDTMIISADLQNATLQEAIRYVSLRSQKLDPAGKGINFVLSPDLIKQAPGNISLSLDNIPMGELLHYISQQANVSYTVKDDGVYFTAKTAGQ